MAKVLMTAKKRLRYDRVNRAKGETFEALGRDVATLLGTGLAERAHAVVAEPEPAPDEQNRDDPADAAVPEADTRQQAADPATPDQGDQTVAAVEVGGTPKNAKKKPAPAGRVGRSSGAAQ